VRLALCFSAAASFLRSSAAKDVASSQASLVLASEASSFLHQDRHKELSVCTGSLGS